MPHKRVRESKAVAPVVAATPTESVTPTATTASTRKVKTATAPVASGQVWGQHEDRVISPSRHAVVRKDQARQIHERAERNKRRRPARKEPVMTIIATTLLPDQSPCSGFITPSSHRLPLIRLSQPKRTTDVARPTEHRPRLRYHCDT